MWTRLGHLLLAVTIDAVCALRVKAVLAKHLIVAVLTEIVTILRVGDKPATQAAVLQVRGAQLWQPCRVMCGERAKILWSMHPLVLQHHKLELYLHTRFVVTTPPATKYALVRAICAGWVAQRERLLSPVLTVADPKRGRTS